MRYYGTVIVREGIKKNKILIGVRLLFVSVILGVGSLVLQVDRLPFYGVVSVFYVASILYLVLLRFKISPHVQITFQLALDLLLILGILHYSGGVDSVFISLLLLPLVAAGMLLPWAENMGLAIFATVGYLGVVLLERTGIWPVSLRAGAPHREPLEVLMMTFIHVLILWVVTLLSASLTRKLKIESGEFAQLKNLHNIILDQIGSGIITVNTKNEVVFVNKGAQQLIGSTGKELIGHNWKPLFFFANSNFLAESWDESSQAVRGFEVSLRRKDGTKIPIGFNVSPLKDYNNEYCGKVMIFRDLTRIKELERKKQQAERLAAIGEMAAGIAHEIRNPLASISGSVELLIRKKAFDSKYSTLVDIILREAQRLNGIIESFLSYTRRPELERKWVDLDQVLEEVILFLRNNGKWANNIQIQKTNVIEGKTRFWFDPNQMKQVFYNLLTNACESMPQGGTIRISLSDSLDVPPMVQVDISDQGHGIPEDRMGKIFTPFFTTKQTGSGIGLPIVHRIVQDHGGVIEVKSQVGEGSTFSVFFPRGEATRGAV